MNKIVKKKFKIDGMHCSSCAMNIDMELEELEGVKEVNTNYAKQFSEVAFDNDQVKVEDIVKSVEKTGYKATLV